MCIVTIIIIRGLLKGKTMGTTTKKGKETKKNMERERKTYLIHDTLHFLVMERHIMDEIHSLMEVEVD
jgi:malate synthase